MELWHRTYALTRRFSAAFSLLALLLLAGSLFAAPAEASHFRYGTLSYTADGSGTVVFSLAAAFRCDQDYGDPCPEVGQVVTETIGATALFFGDGSATNTLEFEVISVDETDQFFIAVALEPGTTNRGIPHTYDGTGPFTAEINSCCRISDLNNRTGANYRVATQVFPQTDNDSPTTSLDPIVQANQNDEDFTFTIPATDNEGDPLRFRVATSAEVGGGAGVPGLTVDTQTGVVSVDAAALDGSDTYYTDQIIIEALAADGTVQATTPVDFLIRPVDAAGSPPDLAISPAGPLTVEVGSEVTYDVSATDPDADELTLNLTSALPAGAAIDPTLPVTGPNPSTTFTWTPAAEQQGSYVFNYSVEDPAGLQDQQSVTVQVVPSGDGGGDPTPPVCGPIDIERQGGELVAIHTSASDPESGIASVVFTTLDNLEGFAGEPGSLMGPYTEGDEASFDPETVSMVEIRGERLDMSAGGAIMTRVTNGAGGASMCDPVIEQIAASVPQAFALMGNVPNPFSGQTAIAFRLAEPAEVILEVFDVLGRKVATLAEGEEHAPGSYELRWDGRGQSGRSLASGTYIYRIEAGSFTDTGRMTLVR